ncbi:MAG: hypothetical protein ACRC8S_10615 [Fimbriiglobus sp.]
MNRSPHWVLLGGAILALGYLPSLTTPFDFIDDGNLVYPAPAGTTVSDHANLWWAKVRANVEHLGPFRPTLWIHWEIFANLFQGDAFAWRLMRLVWAGFAATGFLWLLRELRIPAWAALLTVAAAMWNPYRNEIWTSLTLAEGVAMPYAMLTLVACRKAAHSAKPWRWDAVALLAWLVCLGCKNVFVALLPAMLVLRTLTDGLSLRDAWRQHRWNLAVYFAPMLLPLGHFVYFKMNHHAGQYEMSGPTWGQFVRILLWMRGAVGLDFLGLGLCLLLVGVVVGRSRAEVWAGLREHRATWLAALALFATGIVVYLPMPMMAMRYTMPAVWGVDLLLALGLLAISTAPRAQLRMAALSAIVVGVGVTFFANVGRQERFAARSRFLWQALKHVEETAPKGAAIAWISGDTSKGMLNAEEGIHFAWHLLHRGRGDIRVSLVDEQNQPIPRVELPQVLGEPDYRLAMTKTPQNQSFAAKYHLGRKEFRCELTERQRPAKDLDPATLELLRKALQSYERESAEAPRPANPGN